MGSLPGRRLDIVTARALLRRSLSRTSQGRTSGLAFWRKFYPSDEERRRAARGLSPQREPLRGAGPYSEGSPRSSLRLGGESLLSSYLRIYTSPMKGALSS